MIRSPLSSLADVDIRLLRVFQAVVRHKGFAAAQEELGVTQTTISTQMTQLEERLGLRLCERGRSGFRLTDEGAVVLEASRNLFRSIENFRGIVGSARGELTGEVHFATVDAMWTNADIAMPQAFAAFSQRAPKVLVHTSIAAPQDLIEGLAGDRYHLILAPARDLARRFRAVPLFEEHQSLYCGRGHELFAAAPETITTETIAAFPYAARTYMRDNEGPLPVSLRDMAFTSHMESIALLILSGSYIGYLPAHFAAQWVAAGEMRCLLPTEATYRDTFYLAQRKQEQNRAAGVLFDCILAAAGPGRPVS